MRTKRILLIFIGFIFVTSYTSCAKRIVVSNPKAKVIRVAPKHSKIVVVSGKRYHFWSGKHYRKTKKGYVFVNIR